MDLVMSGEMLGMAVTVVVQFFMVFGGILPYLPQYLTVYRSKDAHGFSTFVCFVIIVSQILRILFWFGKHYELPLLLQSIVMILVMLAMLHICTFVSKKKSSLVVKRITDLKWEEFWKWTYFSDYCVFVLCLSVCGGALTWWLNGVPIYVEALGFSSLLLEACLGIPQFNKNYRNKSTKGMSVGMVLLWLTGDAAKTIYFVLRQSPFQFVMCGTLQCIVDVAVLVQVFIY
ncbi:solute carrier family 66 member 2-like [Halichondria panicea]|uniref:solute carrier family 66 member 2-like n=1 Tax=Halichondria panicea TaxID=6063 RepID=UPI00312BC086